MVKELAGISPTWHRRHTRLGHHFSRPAASAFPDWRPLVFHFCRSYYILSWITEARTDPL